MTDVAIIGTAQTKYEKNKVDSNYAEMIYEVTTNALEDACMTMDEIDNIVTVSNDFWDGRTISCMAVQDACGAAYGKGKNVSTVEGDGTFGILYGAMRILSGNYSNTLVVSHSKGSEGHSRLITNGMFDYIYTRPLGLDAITSSAMQARGYMDKYGLTEEDFAMVSVKNRGNALQNPLAHLSMKLTMEDVLNSRPLADPIKLHDASPVSDGAAAVVLGHRVVATKKGRKPVWLNGIGHCADAHFLGDRDLADSPALEKASQTAYRMAGINNPLKDIDMVELYDAFSYMEPLWLEGMGFCPRGQGGEITRQGITAFDGELPVNPSGGVLSAHAVLVAGMARVIEAALQIRGEAGPRQLNNVRTALAHGINGPCGQSHCVVILGE